MPASVKELVDSYTCGRSLFRSWRKVPSQATASGVWFDLSMSPGNPVPQYYAAAPLASLRLSRSTDGGLEHGGNVSPLKKHLHRFGVISVTATAVPLPLQLLDYLMFYPFVAQDAGEQTLTIGVSNSVSQTLPRYSDGRGVQIMPVLVAAHIGGFQFYVTYTNENGVSGRISQTVTCNTQVVNGSCAISAASQAQGAGPFIPLQDGDRGVRSIETVTGLTSDIGLLALVLVKPLASPYVYDITAPAEVDFLIDQSVLPEIKDDAYLNLICCPTGTLAGAPLNGWLETIWG